MKDKPILALNGGRFFAMLLIVVSHFEFLGQYSFGAFYDTYLHNPTLGVDYFFILSGLGMMLSFIKKDAPPSWPGLRDCMAYALQHIKKIYPLYLAALGLGILYEVATGFIDNGIAFVYSLDSIVVRIIPCLFLLQSATGISSYAQAFCGVFWFLSCLFCIYLVCLPMLCFLKKSIKTAWQAMIAFFLSIAVSVFLVYVFKYIENHSDFDLLVYASPFRRVFYVVCGMILGLLIKLRKNTQNNAWEYLAIPLACAYFFLRCFVAPAPYIVYCLNILICSFGIYALATGNGFFSKILSSKWFVYLGNLSMYVFIIHYLIRMYLNYIVNRLHLQSGVTALIEVVLILFGSYGLSALLHKRNCKKSVKAITDTNN